MTQISTLSYAQLEMEITVAAEEVRGMMMVHNGELFDYHADDAEDVQRFATIQRK